MTDIAALGFNIDSSQADKATGSLNNMRSAASGARVSATDFANATTMLGDKIDALTAKQAQLLNILTQQRDLQTRIANDNNTTSFYTKWGVIVGGLSIAFDALGSAIIRTEGYGSQIAQGELTVAMTILRGEIDLVTGAAEALGNGLVTLGRNVAGADYWKTITADAMAAGEAIRDSARSVGIGTAAYRTFADNAAYLGLSAQQAEGPLKHLNELITAGFTQDSEASRALKELGVELKDLDLKNIGPNDVTQLFSAINIALNGFKDSVAKSRYEMILLGTTSQDVLKAVDSTWYQVTGEVVRHNQVLDFIQQRERDFKKYNEQLEDNVSWWGQMSGDAGAAAEKSRGVVVALADVDTKYKTLQSTRAAYLKAEATGGSVGADVPHLQTAQTQYDAALANVDARRKQYKDDQQKLVDTQSILAQDLSQNFDKLMSNLTSWNLGVVAFGKKQTESFSQIFGGFSTALGNVLQQHLVGFGSEGQVFGITARTPESMAKEAENAQKDLDKMLKEGYSELDPEVIARRQVIQRNLGDSLKFGVAPPSTDNVNPPSGRRERNEPFAAPTPDPRKDARDPVALLQLKTLQESLDPALAAYDAYIDRLLKIDDLTKKLNLTEAEHANMVERATEAWKKAGAPLAFAQEQRGRQLDILGSTSPGNDRFRQQQLLAARVTNDNRPLTSEQTADTNAQTDREIGTRTKDATEAMDRQVTAQGKLAAAAKVSAAAVQEQAVRNAALEQTFKEGGTALDRVAFETSELTKLELKRAEGGNAQLAADREATTQSVALADAYGKGQVAVAKLTAENQAHQLVLAGTISKTQEMAVAHGIAAKAAAEATTALAAKNAATKIELEYAPRIIAAEQQGVAASQEVARQIDVEKQKRELLAKAGNDPAAIDAANAQIATLNANTAAQLANNRAKSAATIGRESQQELQDLNSEVDALKQGTREYEIQKSYIEAINRLKAAGIEPDLQTRITVQQYAEELGTARDRYNDLTEANAEFRRAAVDSFRAIGDELGAVLLKTTNWKDAMSSLKDTLFKVAANVFITQPLERLATNATSGKGFTFGEDFNPGAGLMKSISNSSLGKGIADFFGFGDEEKGTGASPAADRDKFNDPGSLLVEAGKDLAESATKQDNASEKLSGVPSIFERLFGNQLTTTMNVEAATVTVNAAASAGGGGDGLGGLLGMFGGGGGGGGGADVAGGGYASLLGGSAGTSSTLSEGGMSFADLFAAGEIAMHSGGLVGRDGTPRSVPMSLFYGAPRLHQGGFLMPDEIPAILQTGERVLSRSQVQQQAAAPMMAAAKSDGMTVHIGAIHVGAGADPNMARRTGTQLGRAAAAEIRRAMIRNS